MIQVQNRVTLPARRISAEEFCGLARRMESSVYRPRCETMRMLAVGEAWGACAGDGTLEAAALVLPIEANVALAAGLRSLRNALPEREFFLAPPVGKTEYYPTLIRAARQAAHRHTPANAVRAILEPGKNGLDTRRLAVYFSAGFSLTELRPLETMMPLAIFSDAPLPGNEYREIWVPLEDATHLAILLARGWAAVSCREDENGACVRLVPRG